MKSLFTLIVVCCSFGLFAQSNTREQEPLSRFLGSAIATKAEISGTVLKNGSPADSIWVSLFKESSPHTLQFVKATQTESGTGNYIIDNLEQGTYYVLAEPMTYNTKQFFAPTYFGDSAVWSLSKACFVQGSVTGKNINLTPINSNTGSESISGEIKFSDGVAGYHEGDPVVNQRVLVFNIKQELLSIQNSNQSGEFRFDNLPNKDLRFIINSPGKTSKSIILNPAKSENALIFWVTSTKSFAENYALSVNDETLSTPSVYPIPARNKLTIESGEREAKALFYDLSGVLVQENDLAVGSQSVAVDELKNGCYVLVIRGAHSLHQQTIIIEH